MYTPPAFREDDRETLHAAIRACDLATLVSPGDDLPEITHLPLLLEPGEPDRIVGHLAKANPQIEALRRRPRAIAVFRGLDAYVTPSWYATKRETGKVVPTWNYVAVHAVGTVTLVEEPAALRALVDRLTQHHESRREHAWAVDDAPEPFIQAQLRGIVGVVLRVERLIGKWKMSQNRPEADRSGVVAGLETSPDQRERAVARLVDRGRGG
jgi:transcriptional regulator